MSSSTRKQPLRIALISVGLGRVQRGFESYMRDLCQLFQGQTHVVLFRSAGPCGPKERVPRLLPAMTRIMRSLPLGRLAGSAEYNRDCLAFAICLLPQLLQNRFDVIHCVDPPMAFALERLKRIFRFPASLLFTEGCQVPPEYYPHVDHIHHVGAEGYNLAIKAGVPASFMTLIPAGLHADKFVNTADRMTVRKKYGISPETFVILAVSALKRQHKRVDYLIEEISGLTGDFLLWLDGSPEEPELIDIAKRKLGSRCLITHVPSERVSELYAAADVLVHASLNEAFGYAVAEALCSGLMPLTHDTPHFRWLVEDPRCLTDMMIPGNLAASLCKLMHQGHTSCDIAVRAETARKRFDWSSLQPAYLAMYCQLAGLSSNAHLPRYTANSQSGRSTRPCVNG
jgi:glycosyltransferase involved in cell wall biosynthesis